MFALGAADLDAWLAGFFFPFARVAALVATAPILSDAGMPRTIRVALAVVVVVPVVATTAHGRRPRARSSCMHASSASARMA